MVSGVLLARALGPAARGQFAAVVSWAGVMAMVSDFGIGFAISYYAGREPHRTNTLYTQGLVASLVLRGISVAGGAVVLRFVPAIAALDAVTTWIALSTVVTGGLTNVILSLLLGTGRLKAFNLVGLGSSWVYACGVLGLWAIGERRVGAYVLLFAVNQAIVLGAAYRVGRRSGNYAWKWSTDGLGKVLAYGIRSQLASLAAQTNLRLDQVLMSVLVPPGDLGYYVVAVAMSSMTGPIYAGLNVVLTPRVIGAENSRVGALWGIRMSIIAAVIGGSGSLALALVSRWLLPLLFGHRFDGSISMAHVLLAAATFQGMNLILGTTLRGLNRPGAQARAEGIGAVTTIVLLLVLLPRYGGLGAAFASLATYAAVSAVELAMVLHAGNARYSDVLADLRALRRGLWTARARVTQ